MPRYSGLRTIAILAAVAAMLTGDAAAPHSLTVPFFRDDGGDIGDSGPAAGGAALITVTNLRDVPITMRLVYVYNDVTGQSTYQQQVPYAIGAKHSVSWRPVQDDPAEGDGRSVPNMLPGSGNFGSVTIYWIGGDEMTGALIGRYQEFTRTSAMMHVLIEDGTNL